METHLNLPVVINIECPELDAFLDVAPCPQTHVDLAALEYRKDQVGEDWVGMLECFWIGLIHLTLKDSRN